MATEDEMVGWLHQLNRHEFEQTLGDSEGQGSLACCSPWSCKEWDMTEQLNNNKSRAFLIFVLKGISQPIHEQRRSLGVNRWRGHQPIICSANLPETLVLESILAERCTYISRSSLNQIKYQYMPIYFICFAISVSLLNSFFKEDKDQGPASSYHISHPLALRSKFCLLFLITMIRHQISVF